MDRLPYCHICCLLHVSPDQTSRISLCALTAGPCCRSALPGARGARASSGHHLQAGGGGRARAAAAPHAAAGSCNAGEPQVWLGPAAACAVALALCHTHRILLSQRLFFRPWPALGIAQLPLSAHSPFASPESFLPLSMHPYTPAAAWKTHGSTTLSSTQSGWDWILGGWRALAWRQPRAALPAKRSTCVLGELLTCVRAGLAASAAARMPACVFNPTCNPTNASQWVVATTCAKLVSHLCLGLVSPTCLHLYLTQAPFPPFPLSPATKQVCRSAHHD